MPDVLAPVKAKSPPWSGRQLRAMDGATLLRHMVGACLAQVEPNAAAIVHGSRDPEHVHQLRVGLRRLRSAARGMAPFADAMPQGWEPAVMPVFDALGQSRDRFVRTTTLAPRLRAAGAAVAGEDPPSEEDARALARRVGGASFTRALRRLRAFADGAPDRAVDDDGSGLDHLVRRLRKLSRQVTRHARHFDELPFEAQHRARKRLKRLRYLAEFAAPAFAPADVRRWKRHVSRVQDALGRHVDRVLAGRHFAQLAVSDPDAWFAVGWLRAKAERSARAARRALQRLRDADAFW
ncbi:MAG: CHAD domain-containing protein [Burkholderiales bacterium]|nr:CHAD domain-containing protein [Burkholderiales bacterium]